MQVIYLFLIAGMQLFTTPLNKTLFAPSSIKSPRNIYVNSYHFKQLLPICFLRSLTHYKNVLPVPQYTVVVPWFCEV